MAESKGFNLAAALGSVSESDTEQIVRLPVEDLIPDPENFYSIDGIGELADSIAAVGLLDPIRVRPFEGKYMIVSGHRRCAAILLIRDGGSEQFKAGVPCIVEYGEASDAMRKLRLIFANSATRQLSSAELSKQAEEVTRLLYELKEQGVQFDGRMRDHVAEACRVSKSKIARLHAIRENLDSNLLLYFDRGDLNEDAAYTLSQFPQELQFAIGQELVNYRRKRCPSGVVARDVLKNLDGHLKSPMPCRAHAGHPDCYHREARIVRSVFCQYDWQICTPGRCCIDCTQLQNGCGGACREAKSKLKLNKQAEEEAKNQREENRRIHNELALTAEARRFLPLVEEQEWPDDMKIPGAWMRSLTVAELRARADGDFKAGYRFPWEHELVGTTISDVTALARNLGCTTDFVLGLSNDPHGGTTQHRDKETGPAEVTDELGDTFVYFAWRIGLPPSNAPGWYAAKVQIFQTDLVVRKVLWWDGETWLLHDRPDAHGLDESNRVTAWFELPEEDADEEDET